MSQAIPQAIIHHRAFSAFCESLGREYAKEMQGWELQVRTWEADRDKYCPYNLPDQSESCFN